jgi:hypothetical protein
MTKELFKILSKDWKKDKKKNAKEAVIDYLNQTGGFKDEVTNVVIDQ